MPSEIASVFQSVHLPKFWHKSAHADVHGTAACGKGLELARCRGNGMQQVEAAVGGNGVAVPVRAGSVSLHGIMSPHSSELPSAAFAICAPTPQHTCTHTHRHTVLSPSAGGSPQPIAGRNWYVKTTPPYTLGSGNSKVPGIPHLSEPPLGQGGFITHLTGVIRSQPIPLPLPRDHHPSKLPCTQTLVLGSATGKHKVK